MPENASSPQRAAVIGHPISHSLSPAIFAEFARAAGILLEYVAVDVHPDELGATMARWRNDPDFVGCNVTMPHKNHIIEFLDECSEAARACSAVNAVRREGTRLLGDNTDVLGIAATLRAAAFDPAARRTVVFGSGGAARSVLTVLGDADAAEVWIVARSDQRARELAARAATRSPKTVFTPLRMDGERPPPAELYVNATPLGQIGQPTKGAAAGKRTGRCARVRLGVPARPDAVLVRGASARPAYRRWIPYVARTSARDVRRLVFGPAGTRVERGRATRGTGRSERGGRAMSLRYLTAGESHGQALVGIIEGIPSGLDLDAEYLHAQAKRRKLGYGRGNRMNIETDEIRILSGVRFAKTLGSPIALMIENRDWRSWSEIMSVESHPAGVPVRRVVNVPRPGHADYTGGIKYRHDDMRNVLERASARETAMRVGVGSVARRFLEALGITIQSRVVQIAEVIDPTEFGEVSTDTIDACPVRALGAEAVEKMIARIEAAKAAGDTLGGIVEVVARGVPVALGSYAQWDRRLEGEIGRTFMSLNAIKGVEIGLGFTLATVPGSSAHDAFYPASNGSPTGKASYKTNHAGGITGGMTTGQPIVVRAAMKPIATLMKPLDSVDLSTGEATPAHIERSDVCAVPACAVICESLLALVLANSVIEKFGGDSIEEVTGRVRAWDAVVRAR